MMNAQSHLHLHHQRHGQGPPLIILHGLFGNGGNWRSTARRLADCREVYLPDARNHGASAHARNMDYLTLATDVLHFMDDQGLVQADVIGHSMGGKTAMHLALGHPGRVRSLLIVDIAPRPSPSDHLPLIEALEALPLARLQRRSAADQALAAAVPDAGLRAFLLQNLLSRDDTLSWRINLPAIRAAMPELIDFPAPMAAACFPGPVLFVRGALSEYMCEQDLDAARPWFPQARMHTIADSGHWPHAEQPAAFTAKCREFLGCTNP